jgi:uncharacterized membrane protein
MFELLFKYPASVFQKGTFVWLAGWPVWLLIAAIAGVVGGLGFLLLRRRNEGVLKGHRAWAIWALQSSLVALLLLLLWQPGLSVSALKSQQNIVAVVVDDSKSMGTNEDGSTRLDKAVRILEHDKLIAELQKRFQVRLYKTGASLARVGQMSELKASEPATQLGQSLTQIATESQNLPIGAVVLLSDGADNSGGIDLETVQEIKRHQIPIHTIGIGREQFEKDVELSDAAISSRALENSRLSASVAFRQRGYAGQRGKITLKESGKILATHDFTFKSDGGQQTEQVLFNAGAPGAKNVDIEIAAMPGEQNANNNRLTRVFDVSTAHPRILYVEGEPRWEYKFLRRAVEDDKTIEIVSMLRTSQNKIYRQNTRDAHELENGFPTRAEDLFGYQAIILGSVDSAWFTPAQQELLKQFVDRRGGGLLFLAGRAALGDGGYQRAPFNEMLPVTLPDHKPTFHRERVAVELTSPGRDSLICRIAEDPAKSADLWSHQKPFVEYQEIGTPKAGALVLLNRAAGRGSEPALVIQNYGRGRTAVLGGVTWLWQMQNPVEDKTHENFWQQLLRWTVSGTPNAVQGTIAKTTLADESKLKLRADVRDATYAPAPDAKVIVRMMGPAGAGGEVELTPVPTEPGVFEGEWKVDPAGGYVAEFIAKRGEQELGRDSITFRRDDGVAENFHLEQNRELLENLAQQTGGQYYTAATASKLPNEIAYSDAGITIRETKDLWNMPVFFLLAAIIMSVEWLLRRRWGVI